MTDLELDVLREETDAEIKDTASWGSHYTLALMETEDVYAVPDTFELDAYKTNRHSWEIAHGARGEPTPTLD